jgi:succinate dehydrogenase cytochrome b subunit
MTNSLTLIARKYRWKYAGMLAFWIQRLTGLVLLGYLFLHVHTIHMLRDPKQFDQALNDFRSPIFKLLEIGLLGTVILHALNGVRITMVDMGVALTRQRQIFWWFAIGVGALIFIAGAIPIFMHTVLHR